MPYAPCKPFSEKSRGIPSPLSNLSRKLAGGTAQIWRRRVHFVFTSVSRLAASNMDGARNTTSRPLFAKQRQDSERRCGSGESVCNTRRTSLKLAASFRCLISGERTVHSALESSPCSGRRCPKEVNGQCCMVVILQEWSTVLINGYSTQLEL